MAMFLIAPWVCDLTDGVEQVELDANSVRHALKQLDERFPGLRDRLCQDDELRPGLSVSVQGIISGMGMYQKLEPDSEVHFIPAIGGG
jgi:molybdopterin synthase sulfur carrier subunit